MRYPIVLLDNDHTLLDSDASETEAFERVMRGIGVEDPESLRPTYAGINGALWAAVERHEMSPEQVRVARFEQFVAETDVDADPIRLAYDFTDALGACGDLYPTARAALEALAASATLALVTNGLKDVQRARIERLDLARYFDAIVISGEVGVVKPGTEIFDLTFEALGWPERNDALMVGDSLSSDIAGGIAYGIDTCWYNPTGRTARSAVLPTHTIERLDQLWGLAEFGRLEAAGEVGA